MNQLEFVSKFADKIAVKFNPELFTRSDQQIIEQLEKIILSCQMDGLFTIRVRGFEVIDDYVEINRRLQAFYEESNKKSSRRKRMDEDNRYNFIDLKNSDIQLLIIKYYIAIKGEEECCDVMVAIPKVVRKFYFYLSGNYYLPMYQIVDASTYNNSTSKSSKNHRITLKTNFPPISIYRHEYMINDINENKVQLTEFDCTFSKTVPAALFIFAKYGLVEGLAKLGVSNIISVSDSPEPFGSDDNWYVFKPKKNNSIYIAVPKVMCTTSKETKEFKETNVIQHIVYTLILCIEADATLEDIYGDTYWVGKLGSYYSAANRLAKGYTILSSIESVFDINVQEQIHLPWTEKKDIYSIIRWMIREYTMLRMKDTLDVTKKKIRCAEYIAAMYASRLNSNIYRLSMMGNKADIKSIKKVIYIQPMYLITELTKSQLLSFRNMVTDMDSFAALKFTYKGISGVGENNGKIPESFRLLDLSNMGIIDPDASSASDPGVTGSLVPTLHPYEYGYLTDEMEPLNWEGRYELLYNQFKEILGLEEVLEFKRDVLADEQAAKDLALSRLSTELANQINTTVANEVTTEIALEGSGTIVVEV